MLSNRGKAEVDPEGVQWYSCTFPWLCTACPVSSELSGMSAQLLLGAQHVLRAPKANQLVGMEFLLSNTYEACCCLLFPFTTSHLKFSNWGKEADAWSRAPAFHKAQELCTAHPFLSPTAEFRGQGVWGTKQKTKACGAESRPPCWWAKCSQNMQTSGRTCTNMSICSDCTGMQDHSEGLCPHSVQVCGTYTMSNFHYTCAMQL